MKISGSLEVRFFAGLPADGRRINSGAAAVMLLEIIPEAVEGSLYYKNTDAASLENHIRLYEDTVFIRSMLHEMNITAFIGNDSSLPRRSGIDDRPMGTENAVSFTSPKSLEVSIDTPNSGTISGMGIPEGITLIAGGGYHGKSTLLRAIERGIYSHIAGDGREFVVTNPDAVKIRSEDGRRIESVDITPFIMNLPFGRDTVDFRTDNASGSTSQAANIMESIESGAKVFLIDEDTSATNFMIRDRRMRKLVPDENEPITPYIDRIGSLYDELGISSIIVAGGCGDYIDVADTVICMKDYGAHDATERAKSIAAGDSASCIRDRGRYGYPEISRVPDRGSIDPGRGKNRVKISVKEEGKIEFGRERIDMASVEQVSGKSQLRAIGLAINYSLRYMDGRRNVEEIAGLVMDDIGRSGPDVVSGSIRGDLESFRWEELCAALNRLRTLEIL